MQTRRARPAAEALEARAVAGRRRRDNRRRGRHARATDPLAISVRPIAAALARPSDDPPAVGSHRKPGTLPIESWVLLGKPRQQALLGALVAVGLALVMIPVAREDAPATPVNAAGQSVVDGRAKTGDKQPDAPAKGGGRDGDTTPAKAKPATAETKPATPAAPSATTPSSAPPRIDVPAGDGPFDSLRTTGSSTVALTFDDGPDPIQTPRILAMLEKNGVKATFCLVGEQVRKYPEIVRQIAAAGHTLCNHTDTHSLTIGKDKPAKIRADLADTTAAIQAAAPGVPVPFFRAPGGNFTQRLVEVAYLEGMRSLYWQVDPRDWQHKEGETDVQHVKRVEKDVREQVRPGSIVLSHDFNQPDTIAAYESLLPYLSKKFTLGIPPALPSKPAGPETPPPPSAPEAPAGAPAGK